MSKTQNPDVARIADAFERIAAELPSLRPERTDHPLQGETLDGVSEALSRIANAIECLDPSSGFKDGGNNYALGMCQMLEILGDKTDKVATATDRVADALAQIADAINAHTAERFRNARAKTENEAMFDRAEAEAIAEATGRFDPTVDDFGRPVEDL